MATGRWFFSREDLFTDPVEQESGLFLSGSGGGKIKVSDRIRGLRPSVSGQENVSSVSGSSAFPARA